ncbi:MAG: hypothetical protein R3C68_10865 [Myxococcota bacterium]
MANKTAIVLMDGAIRCGRSRCYQGHRRVERVPEVWRGVEQAVLSTRAYMDAIKEQMAINIELLGSDPQSAASERCPTAKKRSKRRNSRKK